jgi:MFS family permease
MLCLSNMTKAAANGILMSVAVLYFTRVVQLPAEKVGLGLSLAAAFGMLAALPAGRLAEARSPRNVTVILFCLLGLFACAYPLVRSFTGLLIVSSLVMAAETATGASVGALVAGLLPPQQRVRASSYMRAAFNLSVIFSASGGAVALYLNTRAVYLGLLLASGALFAAAGLVYMRLPESAPAERASEAAIWPVLRDAPYAVASLLNTVLFMNSAILIVALPIWISQHTRAPAWMFPVVLIVNAASVVLLQVPVSRGTGDVPGGARAMRRAGFLLAIGCALFAAAAGLPAWLAVVLLLIGAAVHVTGEMLHAAGAWTLSFGLAPEHAQGQYQGLYAMSRQLSQTITPALATVLLTGLGAAGWGVFAGLFLAAGAAAPAASRWAIRARRVAPSPAAETLLFSRRP